MNEHDLTKIKLFSTLFTYLDELPVFQESDIELFYKNGIHFPEDVDLKILQSEYVRLFINALPEVPCPPYASFYLEGVLMGKATVEVSEIYNKYGLCLNDSEMPDHIAIELEFLGMLSVLKESYPDVYEDYDFFVSHLKSWAEYFLEKVNINDRTGFYKSLSKATLQFIYDLKNINGKGRDHLCLG